MTYLKLKSMGILLMGLVVPEWFKVICDGCSIPKGFRWLGRARHSIAICRIHDFWYYIIPFCLPPDSEFREMYKMTADFEFKLNRRKISRYKLIGRMYAVAYFWGVRIGGNQALNKSVDMLVVMGPRTHEDLDELIEISERVIPHYDPVWRDEIVFFIRKRINTKEEWKA